MFRKKLFRRSLSWFRDDKSPAASPPSLILNLSLETDDKNVQNNNRRDNLQKIRKHSGKKGRADMMENPYVCHSELDELGPDDSIIDYAVFSDESFILILLLTSKGDVQAYLENGKDTKPRKSVVNIRNSCSLTSYPVTLCIGSQASFVVFGLADGNLLVTPIKLLMDVTWGGSTWATTNVIDLSLQSIDPCLAMPTCTRCFTSNFPPRSMCVMTNKAGNILLIDLQLRKCVSELKAPQSLHNIDVLIDENSIELMVTGFTGAQWIIPIERCGKGFREVLTTCVPSDLHVTFGSIGGVWKLQPSTMNFLVSESYGVIALDTSESVVEVYSTFHSLAHSTKKSYKVPPETWMVHASDNVLFTVSNENELRSAFHFGIHSVRLEYSIIRTTSEWRPLGIIAEPKRQNKLAGIFVVNERGLVRIEQADNVSTLKIASEFIYRLPGIQLNLNTIKQVANACRLDPAILQNSIISTLLSSRKQKQLSKKELTQIITLAKITNQSMCDLLKSFENESMEEQLLPEILNTIQSNPSKHEELMQKVVDLFVKQAVAAVGNVDKIRECDSELSNFLARHESLHKKSVDCVQAGLWKCSHILVQRHIHKTKSNDVCKIILSHIAKNGLNIWKNANAADKLQIMSMVCHLDWSGVSEADGSKICALLAGWQRDVNLPSYHEMCLRVGIANSSRFPKPCQILCLVSMIYIHSESHTWNTSCTLEYSPLSGGHNCSAVIADDDRLMIWGNFTNLQQRTLDISQINGKSKKADGTSANSFPIPEKHLPRILDYPGGRPRAISCGAEHVLVLSASGQVSSWGGNKFGQCGVGHTYKLANLQQLDGDWPCVQSISCGQFHSAFICEDGSLWTFGWGLWGQLGHGGRRNANILVPTKVNGLIGKVNKVQCGRAHTVVLTDKGRVLVSGAGSYGQMGTNEDIKKVFAFTPIDIEGTVTNISCRFYHSICVTEDNRIFEWGRNPQEIKMRMFVMKKLRSAQLKNEESSNGEVSSPSSPAQQQQRVNMNLPAEIPRDDLGLREIKHFLDGTIESIACGLSHSALITTKGTLYMWGKSLDYQLGNGNKNERCEPHQVFDANGVKWANVTCGNNHTVASTSDGTVYAWGRNDMIQCGTITKKPVATGSEMPKKLCFQAKDGRRFVPNVDETQYAQRPTIVPGIKVRLTPENNNEGVDEDTLIEELRKADLQILQAVSSHLSAHIYEDEEIVDNSFEADEESKKYNGQDGPLCTATAYVHLSVGDVKRAIRMTEYLKTDPFTPNESFMAFSSLIWEVIANHEDVQSRQALTAAFRHVPLSDSMRKGKQIAHLWPTVWNDEAAQNELSIDEKIAMLDGFTTVAKPKNSTLISSSSLNVSSKIRVFAQCSHTEPAVVGAAPECSACVDEWTEKVRATLGASD